MILEVFIDFKFISCFVFQSEGFTLYDGTSMLLGIGCMLAYFRSLEVCEIFKFDLYRVSKIYI